MNELSGIRLSSKPSETEHLWTAKRQKVLGNCMSPSVQVLLIISTEPSVWNHYHGHSLSKNTRHVFSNESVRRCALSSTRHQPAGRAELRFQISLGRHAHNARAPYNFKSGFMAQASFLTWIFDFSTDEGLSPKRLALNPRIRELYFTSNCL